MKTEYKRWQVVLGVIVFMMLMGIVGKMDRDSQTSLLNESPVVYQASR
jgi:hypothetical protein